MNPATKCSFEVVADRKVQDGAAEIARILKHSLVQTLADPSTIKRRSEACREVTNAFVPCFRKLMYYDGLKQDTSGRFLEEATFS